MNDSPSPIGRTTSWILAIGSLLALAFTWWVLVTWNLSIALDTAMYLSGAITLQEGGQLYIDFVDLNPPLAPYLHIPAVLLSDYLHIEVISAFYSLLYLASLCSALATYKLLADGSPDRKVSAVLVSLAPLLLLFTQDIFTEMGQRSHLFALAAIPFLIVRLQRTRKKPLNTTIAVITGLFIGLTMSLKPFHYAAILVAAELYLLFRHRNFRALIAPETIAAVCIIICYGLFIFRLPEATTQVFFDFLLPLTVDSYHVYGQPIDILLLRAMPDLGGPIIVGLVCFLLIRSDRGQRYSELADIAAITGLAGAAVYLAQLKGWSYHATVTVMSAYILLAILCSHSYISFAATRFGRAIAAAPLLVIFIVFSAGTSQASLRAARVGFWELKTDVAQLILKATQPNETVMVISTTVDYAYPLLLLTDRRPGTRYAFMFPIPLLYDTAEASPDSLYGYKVAPERVQDELYFLATLNEDLETRDPALVLVERETTCTACPPGMNLAAYLVAHLTELPALKNYEFVAELKRVTVLRKTTSN